MPKVEALARYTVQVPENVVQTIDAYAARVHLSRNKAVAALIRLGIKTEEERLQRLRQLTAKIRNALTDQDAEQYDQELIELVFGPQTKRAQD